MSSSDTAYHRYTLRLLAASCHADCLHADAIITVNTGAATPFHIASIDTPRLHGFVTLLLAALLRRMFRYYHWLISISPYYRPRLRQRVKVKRHY